MTICQLRKQYPHHEFIFFRGDAEMAKAPFLHDEIQSFRVISEDAIFVYLPEKEVNMNELKEMLMEQLQLLHERSKSGDYMPGGLVDLSNAMAHIAEVVVRIK